ncbi:MAG TPA: YggT family protein [Gammaproteobacteria bacterium]|nr:YggT family protein [Gammaproteobacteria bacterium]
MDNTYFAHSAVLLIHTFFGLYILAVMLRFLFQWLRADFYNPVSQFLVKITNPPLKPLRRIIPGWGGIDLASVVLMLTLQLIEVYLVTLAMGVRGSAGALFFTSLADLLNLFFNVFLFGVLLRVILSWVAPQTYNPVTTLLHTLTEPVLAPARRVIPPISGVDLSPVLTLLVLQLAKILVVAPIADLGRVTG